MKDASITKRTKWLLIGAAAGALGFPLFVILHNVFGVLGSLAHEHLLLNRFLEGLSAACFLLALFVCPAVVVICLLWALINRKASRGRARARSLLLIVVSALAAIAAIFFLGRSMGSSTRKVDPTAGYNGSFEYVKSGFPANWSVYHRALNDGDGEMFIDTTTAIAGTRSLKFVVHKANPVGGWRSPGLFQQVEAPEGRSYRVSFWLKNLGANIRLHITSKAPESQGSRTPIDEIIGPEKTGDDIWRQFVYTFTVPEHYHNIRFEINILAPGTLWIDDVRIESQ